MARPVTLFTGQWADLPLGELAPLASEMGYDGLELACWGVHFIEKTVESGRSGEKWTPASWRAPGRWHETV
jgi:hypothetical protein